MSLADVTSWSLPTPAQHIAWLERLIKAGEATAAHSLNPKRASRRPHKCQMVFRNHLSPLDTYCYLKARFGEPNGPMIQMKEDRADSWIHWDYLLFFEHYFIHIMVLTKEIHVHVDSNYSQEKDFWISLVKNLRVEFQKLARPKSDVERSLEKWVIFSNKYASIAEITADLHASVSSTFTEIEDFPPRPKTSRDYKRYSKRQEKLSESHFALFRDSMLLSLLTPILAEAFLNFVIVALCKKEIRSNQTLYDNFIRSRIDVKVMSIAHNCERFVEGIDPLAPEYKRFKKVMDQRNWLIHGNVDPVRERLEEVYFDDLIPLYKRPGDNIADFFGGVRQYLRPAAALRGYEDVHEFIGYVMDKVHPGYRERLRTFLAAQYPGFEVKHNRVGQLFGDYMTSVFWPGLSYDDDLKVD